MAYVPTVIVIPESQIPGMNQLDVAMQRGDGTGWSQSRRLCGVNDPTYTVTHRLQHDASMTMEDEAIFRQMAAVRDLPPIQGTWGEDGIMEAADAQAAMEGLLVYSCAGSTDSQSFCGGVLAGLDLMFVPDPEI